MTTTLTGKAASEYLIKEFETQTGDPNTAGRDPVWLHAELQPFHEKDGEHGDGVSARQDWLNNATGPLLCTATGTTALNTTATKQTISCTTTANIAMTATGQVLSVGGRESHGHFHHRI